MQLLLQGWELGKEWEDWRWLSPHLHTLDSRHLVSKLVHSLQAINIEETNIIFVLLLDSGIVHKEFLAMILQDCSSVQWMRHNWLELEGAPWNVVEVELQ